MASESAGFPGHANMMKLLNTLYNQNEVHTASHRHSTNPENCLKWQKQGGETVRNINKLVETRDYNHHRQCDLGSATYAILEDVTTKVYGHAKFSKLMRDLGLAKPYFAADKSRPAFDTYKYASFHNKAFQVRHDGPDSVTQFLQYAESIVLYLPPPPLPVEYQGPEAGRWVHDFKYGKEEFTTYWVQAMESGAMQRDQEDTKVGAEPIIPAEILADTDQAWPSRDTDESEQQWLLRIFPVVLNRFHLEWMCSSYGAWRIPVPPHARKHLLKHFVFVNAVFEDLSIKLHMAAIDSTPFTHMRLEYSNPDGGLTAEQRGTLDELQLAQYTNARSIAIVHNMFQAYSLMWRWASLRLKGADVDLVAFIGRNIGERTYVSIQTLKQHCASTAHLLTNSAAQASDLLSLDHPGSLHQDP